VYHIPDLSRQLQTPSTRSRCADEQKRARRDAGGGFKSKQTVGGLCASSREAPRRWHATSGPLYVLRIPLLAHSDGYIQMLRNSLSGDIDSDNGSSQSCAQRRNLSPYSKKNCGLQHSIRTSPSPQISGRILSSWLCSPYSSGADIQLWDARM
jgi:hypothetical protein